MLRRGVEPGDEGFALLVIGVVGAQPKKPAAGGCERVLLFGGRRVRLDEGTPIGKAVTAARPFKQRSWFCQKVSALQQRLMQVVFDVTLGDVKAEGDLFVAEFVGSVQ